MTKVQVLQDGVINQIAAGEVVENSASVVKELVENAVDAGASEIGIWIKAGGRQLIKIADDGCGMSRDDLVLAMERHATSKIRKASDLLQIGTMGFRGEALPSIASISKMTVTTSTGEGTGHRLEIDGGKILSCAPASRTQGTTIEVQSLFYNVPARQAFQKSPTKDVAEIHRLLILQALAHPEVRFQLYSQDRLLFSTSRWNQESFVDGLGGRIPEVLGKEFSAGMIPIDHTEKGITVRGYLGKPALSRPNRAGQSLFINRRPVTSRFLSDVVREAYATRLPEGRHPQFVLHLDIDGDQVDVNVHPQKREVRLRDESGLRSILLRVLERALQPKEVPAPMVSRIEMTPIQPMVEPALFTAPLPEPELPIEIPKRVLAVKGPFFLVDEEGDGWLLVDSRRAIARILYEQMLKHPAEEELQCLLVPQTIEFASPEAKLLSEVIDPMRALGISLRPFGGNTFVVDAIPAGMPQGDLEQTLKDLVAELRESGLRKEREKGVALAASRAAGRVVPTTTAEASRLLDQLLRCEVPESCPRGVATMSAITIEELERKFR